MRCFKRAQHVGRCAAGAYAEQHIRWFAKRLHLARKDVFELEVIDEAGEE